jgi:hypothetical protein
MASRLRDVALAIKNPRVERLAAEVAKLAVGSKTEAIGRALEERKARLVAQLVGRNRRGEFLAYLTACVATSATIVDRDNPDAACEFASRFFGVAPSDVVTVGEAYESHISDDEELRFQMGVAVYGYERDQHNGGRAYRWGEQGLHHRRGRAVEAGQRWFNGCHAAIAGVLTLKPNNPAYRPIELTIEDEGRVGVVAEMVEALS